MSRRRILTVVVVGVFLAAVFTTVAIKLVRQNQGATPIVPQSVDARKTDRECAQSLDVKLKDLEASLESAWDEFSIKGLISTFVYNLPLSCERLLAAALGLTSQEVPDPAKSTVVECLVARRGELAAIRASLQESLQQPTPRL